MGLPAKRRTRTSKRDRASHFALKPVQVRYDEQGNPHMPHRAAPATGSYRGKKAVDVAKRVTRAIRRSKSA